MWVLRLPIALGGRLEYRFCGLRFERRFLNLIRRDAVKQHVERRSTRQTDVDGGRRAGRRRGSQWNGRARWFWGRRGRGGHFRGFILHGNRQRGKSGTIIIELQLVRTVIVIRAAKDVESFVLSFGERLQLPAHLQKATLVIRSGLSYKARAVRERRVHGGKIMNHLGNHAIELNHVDAHLWDRVITRYEILGHFQKQRLTFPDGDVVLNQAMNRGADIFAQRRAQRRGSHRRNRFERRRGWRGQRS